MKYNYRVERLSIKKYIVNNIEEAKEKIKEELGPDAVILHSEKIKTGFLGLKEQVEVIAGKPVSFRLNLNNIKKVKTKQEPSSRAGKITPTKKESFTQYEPKSLSEKVDHLETLLTKIQIDLDVIFKRLNKAEKQKNKEQKDAYSEIESLLLKYELLKEIVKKVKKSIKTEILPSKANDFSQIEKILKSEVIAIAETVPYKLKIINKPKIMTFIGPTGSGKTTTIAKLLPIFILQHKFNLAIFTTDIFRLGATEQIKKYAEILDVPVEVIFTQSEMKTALATHADKDIILIDTPGKSFKNKEAVNEMISLIKGIGAEKYMVLPFSMRYFDMVAALSGFNIIFDHFILTKSDETFYYSSMVNLMYNIKKPVAYITTGQTVPDDIIQVKPEIAAEIFCKGFKEFYENYQKRLIQ